MIGGACFFCKRSTPECWGHEAGVVEGSTGTRKSLSLSLSLSLSVSVSLARPRYREEAFVALAVVRLGHLLN